MSEIADVAAAFKDILEAVDVQVYDYVPDQQNLPCIIIYPEQIDTSIPVVTSWVLWCVAGRIEEKGVQQTLSDWLSPDGTVIAALAAHSTLDGVVNSVIPLQVRNWRPGLVAEGRPACWQAELVCEVLT